MNLFSSKLYLIFFLGLLLAAAEVSAGKKSKKSPGKKTPVKSVDEKKDAKEKAEFSEAESNQERLSIEKARVEEDKARADLEQLKQQEIERERDWLLYNVKLTAAGEINGNEGGGFLAAGYHKEESDEAKKEFEPVQSKEKVKVLRKSKSSKGDRF